MKPLFTSGLEVTIFVLRVKALRADAFKEVFVIIEGLMEQSLRLWEEEEAWLVGCRWLWGHSGRCHGFGLLPVEFVLKLLTGPGGLASSERLLTVGLLEGDHRSRILDHPIPKALNYFHIHSAVSVALTRPPITAFSPPPA